MKTARFLGILAFLRVAYLRDHKGKVVGRVAESGCACYSYNNPKVERSPVDRRDPVRHA